MSQKLFRVKPVLGTVNPADIATKPLSVSRLQSLSFFLGIWTGTNLEGTEDPANIFKHVTDQGRPERSHIRTLISALRILTLTQLQGCDAKDSFDGNTSFPSLVITLWLVLVSVYVTYLAQRPVVATAASSFGSGFLGSSDPPEAESDDEPDNMSDSSEGVPAFASEGLMKWLYERCDRRQGKAVVGQNPEKVYKYEARKTLLRDLMKHMTTAGEGDPEEVVNVLNHISALSSDEDSPTMNGSGGRPPDTFSGSTSAAAFVQGFAAMNLSGCMAYEGSLKDDSGHSFATMVLTICNGAYTWWWLRNPYAWNVHQPAPAPIADEMAPSAQDCPTDNGPPIKD